MNYIKVFVATLLLVGGVLTSSLLFSTNTQAATINPGAYAKNGVNRAGGQKAPSLGGQIKKIVDVLLFII